MLTLQASTSPPTSSNTTGPYDMQYLDVRCHRLRIASFAKLSVHGCDSHTVRIDPSSRNGSKSRDERTGVQHTSEPQLSRSGNLYRHIVVSISVACTHTSPSRTACNWVTMISSLEAPTFGEWAVYSDYTAVCVYMSADSVRTLTAGSSITDAESVWSGEGNSSPGMKIKRLARRS